MEKDSLDVEKYFSTSHVAKKTGVSLRQLYYWEKTSLIQPRHDRFGMRMYRRYTKRDIFLINNICKFLREGYNLRTAAKKAKSKFFNFL